MTDQSDDAPQADNAPQAVSFDAEATAELLSLSDKQLKWCLATLRGANATAAAREAGFAGSAEQLRSAGHRVSKSAKVMRFLELARLEGGGVGDQFMDPAERRRRLSQIARGTDKNSAIRACEVIHRMDEADRTTFEQQAGASTPEDTLNEIAEISPEFALHLAAKHEIEWTPAPHNREAVQAARRAIALAYLTEQDAATPPAKPNGAAKEAAHV